MDAESKSPWRFLSPLDGDDPSDRRMIELTRAEELQIVTDMVSASRVSLLYAYSGNGKSSLLNAGIIPHFKRRGHAVFKIRPRPPWSIHNPARAFKECILRQIEVPLLGEAEFRSLRQLQGQAALLPDPSVAQQVEETLSSLESRLARLPRLAVEQAIAGSLAEKLAEPLPAFLAAVRALLGNEVRLLLVCDQFEELFVHYNNSPELVELIEQLGEVWADSSLKVHLLFSIREEWVGSMIAFRQAIPDIFVNYYKLAPLRRKSAADILTKPLEALGSRWEEGLVDRAVDDLALAYSADQANRFSGIDLMPSPEDDPYVELPALQIMAETFWRTREQQERPFSLDHYCSLAAASAKSASEDPSPAQRLLEGYLVARLREIQDPGEEDADRAMDGLRLDCLYALTDRTRHRRALTAKELLAEANRLRPRELEPDVHEELLNGAMAPLVEARLVLQEETRDGQTQFELAHDFAVRSIVREWRRLDHQRAARMVLLQEEQKHKAAKLVELARQETWAFHFLQIGPGVGLLFLLAVTLSVGVFRRVPDSLGASWMLTALFSAVLAVGLIHQKVWSIAVAAVGLLAAVILAVPITDRDPWYSPTPFQDLGQTIQSGRGMEVSQPVEEVEPQRSVPPLPSPWNRTVWVLFSLLVYELGLTLFLCSLLATGGPQRVFRILAAEWIDALALLLSASIFSFSIEIFGDGLGLTRGVFGEIAIVPALILSILPSASLVARWGWTLGLRGLGLVVSHPSGRQPEYRRALLRQALFLVWAVLVVLTGGLLLLATAAIVQKSRHGQSFYDTWAKLKIGERTVVE